MRLLACLILAPRRGYDEPAILSYAISSFCPTSADGPHDGHDAPGLVDELVPSVAAMVDEIVVGFEDAVREPVVAHELPDIFDRIELGAFWRQRNDGDVCRHDEAGRQVPASLIDQEDGMGSGRDRFGDLCKMQVHRLAVAGRQD